MDRRIITVEGVRWLLAETLVIVLGVLIALALNAYWDERQEHLLAIDYIERIQKDLESDLWYVRNRLQPGLERKRAALESVLPVVRGQVPVPDDVEQFFINVARGGMMSGSAQPWFADTTFQDLRSTGNLRVIRDPDIRAQISLYYGRITSRYEGLSTRHTGYVAYVHTAIPAELRDDIDTKALEDFGIDFALERIISDDFRALANEEYNYMLYLGSISFEEDAKTLQSLLEEYRLGLEGAGSTGP